MIVAIALTENHLKSAIDEHFGRCGWYGIYNTESKEIQYVENPNRYADEGAGCTSAEYLMKFKIKTIVAGRFGSRVVDLLKQNDIQMIIPDENQSMESIINLMKNI